MATTDWKSMTDEQLVHHELQLERQMVTAEFQLATNQLEDSSVIGKLRKDIARARTFQRERELNQGLAKDSLRNKFRGSFSAADAGSQADGAGAGFLQGIVDKVGGDD
ncbi:MAG: 50S ribosomal protein L29 [Myxococcota bacterium]|nr:50S ribosomal protein L29 [Myxococcota bacterium]